jgi:hypothetical protein
MPDTPPPIPDFPNGSATTREYLKYVVGVSTEALRTAREAREATYRLQRSLLGDPATDPTDVGRIGELQKTTEAFIAQVASANLESTRKNEARGAHTLSKWSTMILGVGVFVSAILGVLGVLHV